MGHRTVTEKIPEHLLPFIAHQDASLYTAIDHASWRFILKLSQDFFSDHAHPKYLTGLAETGISTERIPLIEEMDQKLRRFGWRAVPVSGFIPPAAFMEFQSLGILPIAAEMRTLDHLAYTPAPDIVHEAAGHAPILADPEYAEYLRHYGEISRKGIFSHQDQALYQAIRELSDIKENPHSTPEQIAQCERNLEQASAGITYVSEANFLARMNWWTVEYGLVGDLNQPKIYGAGLLSSIGESFHYLDHSVAKVPFSLECIETGYDITRPQPQLFVTPSFASLTHVLEQFADTMAYRRGGNEGLAKALQAATVTTSVLDSGVQVSGKLVRYELDPQGNPFFIQFKGPVQLSLNDQELPDQGPRHHAEGFSSPLGKIRMEGTWKLPSDLTESELQSLTLLQFESGVEMRGRFRSRVERGGKNLILSFDECTIHYGAEVLYRPDWGVFDLVCGVQVTSVFGGAADRVSYLRVTGGDTLVPKILKTNLSDSQKKLDALYQRVRNLRESKPSQLRDELIQIHNELESHHREDWLLRFELLELNLRHDLHAPWVKAAQDRLAEIASTRADKAEMITRGLRLLEKTRAA